jgi:release factor glutamine methyltransferase
VKPAVNPSSAPPSFAPTGTEACRALAKGVAHLEAADVPSAALAAELLLLHVLQRDRTWLYAHPEYELTPDETTAYAELIERRSEGLPTQYLTGRQEFWGLEFEVGPGVLIPRPESEHVIEVALERLDVRRRQPLSIADVGTGSGCIAIALARELPQAEIVATDISAAALGYARKNSERHGVSARIEFLETNLLDDLLESARGARRNFDVIVSNPPYVGRNDAASLPREVREHEPAEALFAGAEGLDMYPRLIGAAARALAPNGIFVAELGYNGANYVGSLLSTARWSDLRVSRDLAGIERVISATFAAN